MIKVVIKYDKGNEKIIAAVHIEINRDYYNRDVSLHIVDVVGGEHQVSSEDKSVQQIFVDDELVYQSGNYKRI